MITKDTRVWDKLKKNLLKANSFEVQVGAFEDAKYGPENDNLNVAQVMQWNEEGTSTNPVRPFMRVGFMAPIIKGSYDKYFIQSMERIALGESSFLKEYQRIGKIAEKDLKEVIADWDTPPNSPRTIAEKGFNDPLVDTGTMLNSITYRVEKK